jgi:hypothetical protein
MPLSFQWLGLPHERQHAFLVGRERSVCHMIIRGRELQFRPDLLVCFFCRRKLRVLLEKGIVEAKEGV